LEDKVQTLVCFYLLNKMLWNFGIILLVEFSAQKRRKTRVPVSNQLLEYGHEFQNDTRSGWHISSCGQLQ